MTESELEDASYLMMEWREHSSYGMHHLQVSWGWKNLAYFRIPKSLEWLKHSWTDRENIQEFSDQNK